MLIKDSIPVEYYGLLKELGLPSDKTLTENPAAAFQKEASTSPADNTVALDEPTDNQKNYINLDDAPENILPVDPLVAPA